MSPPDHHVGKLADVDCEVAVRQKFAPTGDTPESASQPQLQFLAEDLIGRPAVGGRRSTGDEDPATLPRVHALGVGSLLHLEPLLRSQCVSEIAT